MSEQWEVANWLIIFTVLADVLSEVSEAIAQGNRKSLGWLTGLFPGPGGQSFEKMMSVLFSDLYLGNICGNAQFVPRIVGTFSQFYLVSLHLPLSISWKFSL